MPTTFTLKQITEISRGHSLNRPGTRLVSAPSGNIKKASRLKEVSPTSHDSKEILPIDYAEYPSQAIRPSCRPSCHHRPCHHHAGPEQVPVTPPLHSADMADSHLSPFTTFWGKLNGKSLSGDDSVQMSIVGARKIFIQRSKSN